MLVEVQKISLFLGMNRCQWANKNNLDRDYHDTEWGVPLYDDRKLFEFLILEGAQAGLSWSTILAKREGYRMAFDNFDPVKIAQYTQNDLDRLVKNPDIIRNRLKIKSTVTNAKAYLMVIEEFGDFNSYIWSFVNGAPVTNSWKNSSEVPASTRTSIKMSKDLKKRGFKFVGETICYAYMQAIGMVNDHTIDCFRHKEISE